MTTLSHECRINSEEKNGCSFIVTGCPRSGTYLMASILNSEFGCVVPVETHFAPIFCRYLRMWGNLGHLDKRRRLLDHIYDFLEIWTPRSERGRDLSKIREYSLLATKDHRAEILSRCNSYQGLVYNLFSTYARLHGSHGLWADKSAFFYHVPLEVIDDCFPGLKVIHIVRDGRDVCLSWRKLWFGPKTVSEAALRWSEHVREKRAWGKIAGDRYLEISYEDLLENPKEVLQAVGEFICEYRKNGDLNFQDSPFTQVLAATDAHSLLGKPIDKSNKDKWKSQMEASDIQLFEHLAGEPLKDSGYEVWNKEISTYNRLRLNLRVCVDSIQEKFTLRYLKAHVKALLPLLIFACSSVKIPLARIINRSIGF